MESIGWIVLSGLVSAGVMAIFLVVLESARFTKYNMVWTLGQVLFPNGSVGQIRGVSLLLHGLAGMVFAPLYTVLWQLFQFDTSEHLLTAGLATGLIHGIGAGFALILLASDDEGGMRVAFAHMTAHLVFGVVLAYNLAFLENTQGVVSDFAALVFDSGAAADSTSITAVK